MTEATHTELLEACKAALVFAEIRNAAKPTRGSCRIISTLTNAIKKTKGE